ncbi:autotransporter outer membrane beta-barrel domain-containing protein [Mesorhizobium huakuii]|uniref:Autotransporter outer membrane beta-barrel domain-containing protein n=1 Tax=Mesorhizobium huakuii TaxID=28104 RepID=A0ABZ0VXC9_9HYPH|nr:autotransporter outer membrane beta-barrel domain-containing protein [Mesorhizobium huakuii]WQC00935.1 autotransporter outer membrane beta-barrel domain-containing protein [Mesorhizobium huakuii]
MKSSNGTVALSMAGRFLGSERPSALAALTVALALSTAPAWADGGNGAAAGAGQGGVDGSLPSAMGQNAANGATAGGGGGGIDLTTGNGAAGGSGGTAITFNDPNGVSGPAGTTGQVISASGTISTSVSGGTGGPGSNGVSGVVRGGGGGGGGVGISATADTVVTGSGSVKGGSGGVGGSSSNGGGGGGGVGVFSSASVTIEAGGSVTGGVGGRGNSQAGGGGGAAAIVLTGGGTVENSGNLLGGTGGTSILGGGGDGGAGVLVLSGGTVFNGTGATILGGTGGQAGAAGTAGDGGAGIKGANIAIINAGTIGGGAVGAGGGTPLAGKAIQFTGGVNSLEIRAGSTISGNVVAFSTADTFKLGGDTSASFDVSQIGPGAKYDGFGLYEKTGNSTWTLTGTTTAVTPWTLSGGVLQISSDSNLGAASGNLTFDGGTLRTTASFTTSRNVLINSTGAFDTAAGTQLDVSGKVTGTGTLVKNGAGTLNVTSYSNSYTGGNIVNGGTLAGNTVAIRGDILNNGAVSFLDLGPNTFSGNISGTGSLDVEGIGTLTLTGTNTHSGGSKIGVGKSVSVASDKNLGAATGLLTLDGGELQATASFAMSRDINLTPAYGYFRTATGVTLSVGGQLGGLGGLYKEGAGTMILTGNSTYSGRTTVDGGKLVVEGSLGNTETTVNSGGTLGGSGSIGGSVIVADGAVLAPGSSPGALTVGSLILSSGSTLDYELGQAGIVGGGVNDLIDVAGNLTLDGTLNITDVGGFGPGIYRLINFGGMLTDNGLELGNLPVGVTAADLTVQTSVANQVNLISSVGTDLLFWDGDAAGNANNDLVDGGNGIWTATSPNWTTSTGLVNGAMKPQPGFAVFQTLGGLVTADDSAGTLAVTGMQFAADGYRIEGDAITLAGAGGDSIIRVGYGSAAGAGYTATIASVLTGASSLTKTDAGTLVLSGANTYTGGTTVLGGVLSVSADNNLGAAAGALTLSGGTLRNTAAFSSARDVTLSVAGGIFDTVADLTLSGAISGAGSLAKTGTGTLALTADNSYIGGTTITSGTLQLGNGGASGSISGNVVNNGTLAFNRSNAMTLAGAISGSGTVMQQGSGSTTLTGANSYSGGTTITGGKLIGQASSFGTGGIFDNAALVFDQPADAIFAAVISGSGSLTKTGLGNLNLTGTNTLNGATSIEAGKLSVNGSLANSTVAILDGGALGGNGTVGTTTLQAGGVIAPGNSIGTLTVNGNYVGAGGTLEIEAMLGGDTSSADKLVITGDTSGATNVKVIPLGGGGAQTSDGIKIVDVGGISAGTFSLQGDYVFQGDQAVVAGAYAYRLYQNGISTPADGDWYLRSALINAVDPGGPTSPLYSPALPVYEAYAGVLQSFTRLGTLQQRVGNRSWSGADPSATGDNVGGGSPIWGRIEAAHSAFDPGTSTTGADYDADLWRLQAGLDVLLSETQSGSVVGGLTVHYGTVKSDVSSAFGLGSIDATGYGFGGTLTWYGKNGFYIDTQADLTWFNSDLSSTTLGRTLAKGNNGFGYGLGIEAGRKIALQGNWSLTPQAQLSYASVDFDSFTDPYGALVSNGVSNSLIGRLGLSADYESQWKDKAGQTSRSHVYGIANLYHDFLDGTDADVSDVAISSKTQALWGGLGLGGSLSWADDRYAVHGEVLARSSLQDFGDSYAVGGSVGFKVKW